MAVAPDLCGIALEDRYELHELIGEGAFGRVYRGRDRRLDRAVAVKVIKPWWSEDPAWIDAFARETRMLARLSDPGIVQIHDVGRTREGPYYVSELVEGENLAQRLGRAAADGGGLGDEQARAIALGLCHALAGAHAQRIVHRDVKPANVLLADGGGVKVGDFGVARLAEATTDEDRQHPSLVVGTPKYMAPEQGRGGPITPATDVYSVGAVLYEMLAGSPPFTGDSPVALALSHLVDSPPPLPAGVGAELREVVDRALAKDPGDRYPDAGAMAAALAGVRRRADGSGSGSPDPTQRTPRLAPRTVVNPSARRRSVALLGLAGGLLGALIVTAILVGGGHGSARASAGHTVEVPLLVGENAGDASGRLHARHLRARIAHVPAPGIRPGTVTSQRPVAGRTAAARSVVRLSVAEVPRWRTVTTFSGRASAAFRIRGERWRILSSVADSRHCSLLVLFCRGTSAQVLRSGAGSSIASAGLGDGSDAPHVFATGPGSYRVTVDPASSDTRWSIRVQDDY